MQYHDGAAKAYPYSPSGRLIAATNSQGIVTLAYDALGRVLAESMDVARINSVYDAAGQRINLTSSLGAHIQLAHNVMGDILHMDAGGWQAAIQRGAEGWETTRLLPGDVRSQWKTDGLGRPVAHEVFNVQTFKTDRRKNYVWAPTTVS